MTARSQPRSSQRLSFKRNHPAVRFRRRARRLVRERLGIPRLVRYSLCWDLIAGLCTGAYMGMTMPFFTKIARGDLGAPQNAIALMSAAMFIGFFLSPIWARQMEGRAKMPFVLGSWLTARSLLFLAPLVASPWAFVAMVGGLQFIGTISTPAYTSLMRDIYPDRMRGRLMGYVRAGMQTVMFLATLTAGRLLDHHITFRVLFPIAGLFGFAAAFAFWRVRPLPQPVGTVAEDTRPLSTHRFILDTLSILKSNESYRWFAFSVMTYGFGNLMIMPVYQLYQVDILRINSTQIANLTNFASLWSIVGAFYWGRYMDRRGPGMAVLFSIVCIALVPIVYLCSSSVPALAFAALLAGFGFAGIELSYMASILTYSEPGRAAQYQSLHSLLLGIRGVIAPLLGIPLLQRIGYPAMFKLSFVIMLGGVLLQWLAVRSMRRNASV